MSNRGSVKSRSVGVVAAIGDETRNQYFLGVIALSFCMAVAFSSVLLTPHRSPAKAGAVHETFSPRAPLVILEETRVMTAAVE